MGRGARWIARFAVGSLVAGTLGMTGSGPGAPPVMAATSSAFVLDTVEGGTTNTVRVFRDPQDAVLNVEWSGERLAIQATPAEGSFFTYDLRSGTGQPLSVGTFGTADINGCTGSLTIHELEPAVQLGTFTPMTRVSASFERTCGFETTFGELRYRSDDPYSALGASTGLGQPWPLAMTGAAPAFVGRQTTGSTVTLQNLGTTTLTLGPAAFDPAARASWQFTANTCTGSLSPGATCTITGKARAWVPGGYEDQLVLPATTTRGHVRIFAPSQFAAARFVPIDPIRLMDTRTGLGLASSIKHGVGRTFPVTNRAPSNPAVNIPADAVAVAGNLTLVKPTSAGYAALATTASNSPSIRTLYSTAGDTRGNAAIVRLSEQGTLGLTWLGTAGSSAHAVFDATGYFVPTEATAGLRSGNFRPWPPTRVVDTKNGRGIAARLPAGRPRTFSVPLVGVDWESTAVAGVLSVIRPAQGGSLYIGPAPVTAPKTNNLSFRANDSRANSVIVKLSSSPSPTTPKKLTITYVGAAGTYVDVLFDIHGTFGSGHAGYVPLVPSRVVDSAGGKVLTKALPAAVARTPSITNRVPTDPSRNLPADESIDQVFTKGGVTGTLWMMQPTVAGTLTAMPPGTTTPPRTSSIRSPAGDRRAMTVVLGTSGQETGLKLWYAAPTGATTHVMFDLTGYFLIQ